MKRKFAYILISLTLLLSGCQKVESVEHDNNSMFVKVETTPCWGVVYHKKTKVMYVVSYGAYNGGNFTVLVDADGKPMLWEE